MMPWGLILRLGGPVLLLIGAVVAFRAHVASIRSDERGRIVGEIDDARQKAKIADLEHALAIERRQNEITEKANADRTFEMADANSRLLAYAARLRAQNGDIGTGTAVSGDIKSPIVADGPDQPPLMADLAICNENTVRLKNAQTWWLEQEKVQR